MSQAGKYVTRAEFDPVKEAGRNLSTQVQILTIRVEVIAQDLYRLTNQVADIAEDLNELRADLDQLRIEVKDLRTEVKDLRTEVKDLRTEMRTGFADVRAEFQEVRAEMHAGYSALAKSIADGHAALLSAVMNLSPR